MGLDLSGMLDVAKVIGIVVSIVVASRFYEPMAMRKAEMRKEYRFAKQFLNEVTANPGLHPYALTTGYHAIAGRRDVSAGEIAYILSLREAPVALSDYFTGRSYLALAQNGERRIVFRKAYETRWSRSWRKWAYFLVYTALALIVFVPVILSGHLRHTTPGFLIQTFLVSLLAFGPSSIWALRLGYQIRRAEVLVENQQVDASGDGEGNDPDRKGQASRAGSPLPLSPRATGDRARSPT